MVSVVANGASGQLFTYVEPSASTITIPSISVWAGLAPNNPYRREWDSFAALLCVNGQDRSKFALIKNVVERYGQLVMDAASRHLSVSPRAKMQVVEEARA